MNREAARAGLSAEFCFPGEQLNGCFYHDAEDERDRGEEKKSDRATAGQRALHAVLQQSTCTEKGGMLIIYDLLCILCLRFLDHYETDGTNEMMMGCQSPGKENSAAGRQTGFDLTPLLLCHRTFCVCVVVLLCSKT